MVARLVEVSFVALSLNIGAEAKAVTTYGTYYDETAQITCQNTIDCRLNFSQLPADRFLMVSKVSCAIESSTAAPRALSLKLSATPDGAALPRTLVMSLPTPRQIEGGYFTNTREDTHYLLGQGRFPFVEVRTSSATSFSMACTIIGELVTPVQ